MDLLLLAQDVTWGSHAGDAIHLGQLARHLALRGHRVRVIARRGAGLAPNGVEVRALASSFNLAFTAIRRPIVFRSLVDAVAAGRPDVIYSRGAGDVWEAMACHALGIPLVFEMNGDVLSEREAQRRRPTSGPERAIAVAGARRAFALAKAVVAVTDSLARRLLDEYGVEAEKVRVVPNAVDRELFRPMEAREARAKLGLPRDAAVVLFVGNLAPWQGVAFLLRAFERLRPRRPNALLVVVGDGQEAAALRNLTERLGLDASVRFLGSVPYDQVPWYIAAADACAAPMTRQRLRSGSSAMKVHEYLAVGRPVVASRIPGLEFLEEQGMGLLVPPEDDAALSEALLRSLDDDLRQVAAARGPAYVRQRADWSSVAAAVEEVCRWAANS